MSERTKEQVVRRVWTPEVKVQAVLALWSGRRRPAELSRELGVKWTVLRHWQERAVASMLATFEGPGPKAPEAPLSPGLSQLLARQVARRQGATEKLGERLAKLQTARPPAAKPQGARPPAAKP
jgi:transposase-like protein